MSKIKIVVIGLIVLVVGIFGFIWAKPKLDQIAPTANPVNYSLLPVEDARYTTSYSASYTSGTPVEDELEGVQCPIPMKDRVRNYTGIQCVFASLECLGRWAEDEHLTNPPLTSRSDCKSFSGPGDAPMKLSKYGVRYRQAMGAEGIKLIKQSMKEGRGVLWGVPGHAMVLCHYDEEKDVIKWIDNSDRSLRIQTSNIAHFKQRWDGWVIAVYAEPDLFPTKALGITLPNRIPIMDRNNPQGEYPKNYIPSPTR